MGVCASPDGVALPVGPTVPVPTAYFPLTNGSTFSWPIPEYWAYNTSAIQSKQTKFVKDSYFGTVVQCNASLGELRYHDVPCTVLKQLLQDAVARRSPPRFILNSFWFCVMLPRC